MRHKITKRVSVTEMSEAFRPAEVPDIADDWGTAIHDGQQYNPILIAVDMEWWWDEDESEG